MNWKHWQQRLYQHYSAPLTTTFAQFRLGAMVFFLGGVLIYGASQMPGSLRQELLLLAGLVIGGGGFIIAMLAQVRMLISRLLHFFSEEDPSGPDKSDHH